MRENKGVTLVALVVTIVVLLILLAISLFYITGRNNIIEKAQESTNKENQYENQQQNRIEEIYNQLDKKESTDPIVEEKPSEDEGKEDDSQKPEVIEWPYVPDGFKVIPGKDNGLDGFVITDDPNGEEGKGNEFVFIPVLNIDIFKEDKTYREDGGGTKPKFYDDESDSEYQQMIASVEKNKGFYIGRYEISLDSSGIARNKYLVNPAYNITKYEAQTACEKFGIEYNSNHTSSKNMSTGLLWGKNWDAVLRFLDGKKTGTGIVLDESKLTKNSSEWGNYYNQTGYTIRGLHGYKSGSYSINWKDDGTIKKQGSEATYLQTGASERNMAKNIYDFGGNFEEWTRETTNKINKHVYRGGSAGNISYFGEDTGTDHALYRTNSNGKGSVDISARMLMFITD